ncbi:MAG: hypothetical protein J6Y00_05670 [Paludibacteraceae bacterium]|nr:hypothetical protein [Paludibacteraceae bacterium]
MSKGAKITLWVVVSLTALVIGLVTLGLKSLSEPGVINALLARYVPRYAHAEVTVCDVDVTLLSSYPDARVELVGVRVATPALDTVGEHVLVYDTLLVLDTLRLNVCLPPLLRREVCV